ncbi:MAG TPA: carbamoyl-phosphate synthase large subunit [Victivallales bacterium]|nr:carbamoyl-phosphate synthase large subunit [Victivallales bacterium]
MPKRTDIKKIMLIGSGPIVIGQACEFDYSGVQACKALKEEGYSVILVNSNPATIMTDPEFADRTYIEPLDLQHLTAIIDKERPDALLPTLGGQTALNLAMTLYDNGILQKYNVEMIGAQAEVIRKAENRDLFKKAMKNIGLEFPRSASANSYKEACKIRDSFNSYPLIIRPGFTLGGTGGGIAYDDPSFEEIVQRGLFNSPNKEVLIEESVIGWKEFELEVMRDHKDNCVIVCSIENLDPMGIHTGDSITVAPAQTLTDREYQKMRDAAIAVLREIGVATGGSNVQFALNPENGKMFIIEMNPRVSRSSALASKATGFPIAKIATKLAIGYTLDEIRNDITRETPACFEPTIDYVVTKIPRFAFEKFQSTEDILGTQMKSVGEAMSIGKNFKQSFQKALRSLETGRAGFGVDGKDHQIESLSDDELEKLISKPNSKRIFAIRASFKRHWTVEKVFSLSKIDKWFLRHLEELAYFEEEIKSAKDINGIKNNIPLLRQAKEFGYSDKQIAFLLNSTEKEICEIRKKNSVTPVYGLVDTCAAEFTAFTPYFYSTYGVINEAKPSSRKKIMIIGGGPNRIGQGIEFDYCCVHASFALREAGFETIMVNSNPETVSTDYDTSDRLYFEPLTLEDVLNIYENEKCYGAIVQFSGQTPLNLAKSLEENGVNIIGTKPENIEIAEDRKFFQQLVHKIGIKQPKNGLATTLQEAIDIAKEIGYPVLVRPSFVLGGRAMVIVYKEEQLIQYMFEAIEVSEKRPVLIDQHLDNALEVDVDCISDGEISVIGGIMEHVEIAGIHSGDSACMIPTFELTENLKNIIREQTYALAKELKVCGLMNVQFAIKDNEVYILEVNPRASRTIPFVSKTIGVPLAKLAALVMAGAKLKDLGFTKEIIPEYACVKEAVLPFAKFPGIDVILSPEMKSTGEVMGIASTIPLAYLKSQIASGSSLPQNGNIFISLRDEDKIPALPFIKELEKMGFTIYATLGTSTFLRNNGIKSLGLFRISEGRPNAIDFIEENTVSWIINTPYSGIIPKIDEIKMRASAVAKGIPLTTTLSGFKAAVRGLMAINKENYSIVVKPLQEYHKKAPKIKITKLV